ncbi:bifunctional 3-dehydroquinate dehydratase/shikimate dehydrogenase, chloroplastic-like [Diospyros lotus]|uniref:bifunctional 3-dehydroquinate dehydratase/shikimate dehydrogenase, chloroplastic-like n=1 Tax=Diospyros lotus TaxID=55363 RepID=UPI002257E6B4|nr:bifunctional 3-dehydroquinate dehydratase/shikimate dehydrogenase, chloroplastic-like [Diospyros lotus]
MAAFGSSVMPAGISSPGGGGRTNGSLLCTPVTGGSVELMLAQMKTAKEIGADVVEIRLDCLRQLTPSLHLPVLVRQSPLPTVVTCRPIWEGGQYEGDEKSRQDALRLAMELGADYIDVELKVAHEFNRSIMGKKPDKFKVIVSSHNFDDTPPTEAIGDLVARIQSTGADVVKIATTALDITDVARIFQITVHSQVPVIGIAMGERGLISRLLAPKFNGYLTYGALEPGTITAPGQPTAKDLLDLYNFRLIRPDTKVYGIIGKPVGHSKSPLLFNESFKKVGLDSVYVHLLVDDVKKFFSTYTSIDFAGFSCTIPHKEVAMGCMDEIDPTAKKIGAVNNIVRRPDGTLKAYNTDYIGAISAIEDVLRESNGSSSAGSPLAGRLFVVLGAGGAGKSLAYGAQQKGARVVVANRTFERAKDLAAKVGGKALHLHEVNHFHPEERMILANATSVGMKPNIDATPISKEALKHYELVFDAIYTPKDTRLLREARECGIQKIVYGTEMLIRQGFEQFKNFTGFPEAPEELFRQLMSKHA